MIDDSPDAANVFPTRVGVNRSARVAWWRGRWYSPRVWG